MSVSIICGDALEILRTLADCSVHCCITSPPYYGLRDYGTAKWEGGDAPCLHEPNKTSPTSTLEGGKSTQGEAKFFRDVCAKCGARRIDAQLGLERTPDEYVAKLVSVFREVRRVLRDDGTLWLNLGDSYFGSSQTGGTASLETNRREARMFKVPKMTSSILKPKDLIGIPWRVAFALQADGWYLRQDIIWAKPNPMPESVRDRCTKAHEYVFMLSKKARYYYDAEAVKEESVYPDDNRKERQKPEDYAAMMGDSGQLRAVINPSNARTYPYRNRRSVWTVATQPYKEAHFATFPPELIKPMVLAGCPETVCAKCGAPRTRMLQRVSTGKRYSTGKSKEKNEVGLVTGFSGYDDGSSAPVYITTGWKASCNCIKGTKGGTVLDPFAGSGTTGMVSENLGRNSILIELNPKYIDLIKERTKQVGMQMAVTPDD